MQRNFKSLEMRSQISKKAQKPFRSWLGPLSSDPKGGLTSNIDSANEISNLSDHDSALDIQGQYSSSNQSQLKNEKGFIQIFLLSLLPIVLSGILVLLFSQFFLKNWMESVHICRTELLATQKATQDHLERLMDLNPMAKSLRIALKMAQIQLAIAIAMTPPNPALVAKAKAEIARIQQQRKQLELLQKSTILAANLEMARGVQSVVSKLRLQSQKLQSRLPDLFEFRIHSIRPFPTTLAVRPDKPDIAPVYELQKPFTQKQALSVSWISEFKTKHAERYQWIQNRHKKKDGCSASLFSEAQDFSEGLVEDKSSWKL